MTPLQISMLLDIHCGTPIENLGCGPQQDAMRMFVESELIEPHDFKLRPRGQAYVSMLMSMPLPVAHWTIPGPWTPSVV